MSVQLRLVGGCDETLPDEVERLLKVEAIHGEALLMDRALVYEVDLSADAFTYISPHVEQLTGFTAARWHAVGAYTAMFERCHAEDRPKIAAALEELGGESNRSPDCLLQYRWRDNFGRWRWCSDRFRLRFDRRNRPARMIGCVREVTEQVNVLDLRQAWLESDSRGGGPANRSTRGDEDALAALLDTSGLGLTRIQRRVLGMVLVGLTNKQMALRLHRSVRTVEDHRYRIMRKLGAESTVDLVRKALNAGVRKAA